jgi:hypothetical protein
MIHISTREGHDDARVNEPRRPRQAERFAHQVTDASQELTESEKQIQHEAVRGVEQMLGGLTDLGALAIAAVRDEETD